MSRVPRAARVLLLTGLALLLVLPGAIAPAPTLTPGQIQITDGGFAGDSVNFTDLYTYNTTIGGRAWVGNATASYLESTTPRRIDTNSTLNVTTATTTMIAFSTYRPGDSANRFSIDALGRLCWTDGSASGCTSIQADIPNSTIATTNDMRIRTGAEQVEIGAVGTGIKAGLRFGIAQDTLLYRSTVSTLKTDGNFIVGGGSLVLGNYGAVGTCDANTRGAMRYHAVDSGAADTLQVCMKSAADTYSWKTVVTG